MSHVDFILAAYNDYKKIYTAQHPPPAPPAAMRAARGLMAALSVLVAASIVVSASRTIVEFGGGVVGVAAFVMVELGIIAYAYMRTENALQQQADADHRATVGRLINAGLALSLLVALGGNLHAVFHQYEIVGGFVAALDIAVPILIAVSAPALAFISGDALGMLAVNRLAAQREADARHAEAMAVWTEALNEAWQRDKKPFKRQRPKVSDDMYEIGQSDNRTKSDKIGQRRTKSDNVGQNRKPSDIVRQYFVEHPDALNKPLREVAEYLNVSADTVSRVRKQIESMGQ